MANLQNIILRLESLGLSDLLVPVILIFSIVFAILNTIKLFKKNINLLLALVISLLTVIPHVTGSYPPCYDIVIIINTALPKIGLVIIGLMMFLLVIGLFGLKLDFFNKFLPIIAIMAFIITLVSFLTTGTGKCAPLIDLNIPFSGILYYLVPIAIMLIIILFITGKGKKKRKGGGGDEPY